jgi:hypothetical protein
MLSSVHEGNWVAEIAAEETPLQAAVWLSQDLGIAMPPIAVAYGEALQEIALGRVFATRSSLCALTGRAGIARYVATNGWPANGLALGFVEGGLGGRWFYTLVGARQIISLSLRMSFLSDVNTRASAASISAAHAFLEAYLTDEVNLTAMVDSHGALEGAPLRIVSYDDDDAGGEIEWHATWTREAGISDFVKRAEIFTAPTTQFHAAEAETLFIRC